MLRRSSKRRAAFSLFVVAVIAVVVSDGRAQANVTQGISSISTQGSTAVQITPNSTEYTLYVPSNHSGDSSEPITVVANDPSDIISIAGSAFFNSGQSIVVNVPFFVHVDVCTPGTTNPTDGTRCDDYALEIEKANTNFAIAGMITTSPVDISSFSPDTTDYNVRVDGSTDHLGVTVQPADTQASATIQGIGGNSQSVALQPVGSTTDIHVVVTSANTLNQQQYNIHVSRGNTDAALSNLTIAPGTLTPDFASGTTSYTAKVASTVNSVAVTPTNENGGTSVVKVDGSPAADASNIPLDASDPTHIVVTSSAEDPNSAPSIDYTIDVSHLANETLTVATAGTGSGTVTGTSPDATISCASGSSTGCTAHYDEGTSVTLAETPADGSLFAGWSGDCSGTDTTATFDMPSAAAACTATFTSLGGKQTASPFTVNDSGDTNIGGCYKGSCNLRAALAAATAGGTIKFTVDHVDVSNTYLDYELAKTLTIDGGSGGVTIDGFGISLYDGTFTLKNLTFTDGEGLDLEGGTYTLTNVNSEGNSYVDGAGMYFHGTRLTMTGGEIGDNQAEACAGIEVDQGNATLTDVVIDGNSADAVGGGLCIGTDTSVTMNGGLIVGNQSSDGGGVYADGTFVDNGTSLVGNLAPDAGAAFLADQHSTATFTNATFTENPFSWTIESFSDNTVSLVNSTIGGNGGGIGGDSPVTLLNSIVAGNPDGGDCLDSSLVTSLGHNVFGDPSCGEGQLTDRANSGDPRFGDMTGSFTLPLENGSPALDAGTKTGASGLTVPAKDAGGTARPQGGGVDAGATEMPEHKLTIKSVGGGTVAPDEPAAAATGIASPGGWFVAGSTVELTATPADGGHAFGAWSGACTGHGTTVDVTMDADKTCTATFVDAPTITSFTPSHGRIRSLVTITGTNLDSVTDAAFGLQAATIKSATPTKLTLIVPDGLTSTDPVQLGVQNAAGVGVSSDWFTPDWPAPKITSFSPAKAAGGATLTITGKDFLGVTAVVFTGGATGTIVGTPTDTSIKVLVPTNAETGEFTVETPGGANDSPSDFTFLAPPTIDSFAPEHARFGETITITGHDLATTTGVAINGVTVKPSTKPTDTQVTAVVPATATDGSLPIVVFNAGGQAPSFDNFTLDWWTPTVAKVTPASARPGAKVTITGTHFTRAGAVVFGLTALQTDIKVVNDTTITTTVPSFVGPAAPIVVVAGDGTTTSTDDVEFTPLWPQPVVTSFTPAAAKAGATVTITGKNFLGVTDVAFNGHDATITGTRTDTKLMVTVPDTDDASGLITVTTAGATPTGQSKTPFLFLPKPENLTLDDATQAVGQTVTISGNNLGTTKSVTFNGHAAKFTIAADKASVTATVPDADDDGGTISVTNAGGTADVPTLFTQDYLQPVVTSFTPLTGLVGSKVTITGSHFRGTTQVTFDGIPAGYFAVSDTKLTATVPSGLLLAAGKITVHNAGGTGTSVKDFTPKWPTPTIKSFTPTSTGTGTVVTITGTGFVDVTGVQLGGEDCAFAIVSPTEITLTVPDDGASGKITVTTKGGHVTSAKTLTIA